MPPPPAEPPREPRDLHVVDRIVLALRAHRSQLGLSQRDYAGILGMSKSSVGRLESDPCAIRLGEVLVALEPTGFSLRLWDDAAGVEAEFEVSARLARDASGRRLPAHGLPAIRTGATTWEWSRYGAWNLPTWTYRRASPPPGAGSPPGFEPPPAARSLSRGDGPDEPDLV